MVILRVYIVPTYDCDLKCPNCYSKKYKNQYPSYLSWIDFVKAFDFFKFKTKNVSFIGGEPTKWKFINEALMYLEDRNFITGIFTNCLKATRYRPRYVIVNGTNLLDDEFKSLIVKNIRNYMRNGVKIRLRFNLSQGITNTNISEMISLSKKYANSVSLSLQFPTPFNQEIGEVFYRLSRSLTAESIRTKISRATPLCIFTSEQIEYLKRSCKLSGQCPLPSKSIVINPDGQTIQPCVELDIRRSLVEWSKNPSKSFFSKEIEKLRRILPTFCNDCILFANHQCCCGCLSYKTKSFLPVNKIHCDPSKIKGVKNKGVR